jgi:hypothetical protein
MYVSSVVSPDVRDAYFGSMDRAFEGFSYIDETAGAHLLASARSSMGDSVRGPAAAQGKKDSHVFSHIKKY